MKKRQKKQKKSAIPASWLDDGPMPALPESPQQYESEVDASSVGDTRARLSTIRRRTPAKPTTPSTPKGSIDSPQVAETSWTQALSEIQADKKKPSIIGKWKNRKRTNLKATDKSKDRLRYAGVNRPSHIKPSVKSDANGHTVRRRQAHRRSGSQPVISININLPKLRLPKAGVQKLWYKLADRVPVLSKKQWILAGSLMVLVIAAVGSGIVMTNGRKAQQDPKGVAGVNSGPAINFKPLVPATINGTNDQPQLRINHEKHTVSFQDTFAQTQFVITQQNLPDSFKNDSTGALNSMLSNFGIDPKNGVTTAIGKLYLTTKTNPAGSKQQFGVLKLNDSVMFISAKRELSPETWKAYFSTLHVQKEY